MLPGAARPGPDGPGEGKADRKACGRVRRGRHPFRHQSDDVGQDRRADQGAQAGEQTASDYLPGQRLPGVQVRRRHPVHVADIGAQPEPPDRGAGQGRADGRKIRTGGHSHRLHADRIRQADLGQLHQQHPAHPARQAGHRRGPRASGQAAGHEANLHGRGQRGGCAGQRADDLGRCETVAIARGRGRRDQDPGGRESQGQGRSDGCCHWEYFRKKYQTRKTIRASYTF